MISGLPDRSGAMALRISCLLLLAAAGALAAGRKPNVLFLFADDMAWSTVGALGSGEVQTPHLDRLAARGTVFKNTYNPGGWHGAICVASRTMLMTGRQLWHARDAESSLNEEYVGKGRMWPQLIAEQGYRTCFSGKWHVQADHRKVFGEIRNFRSGGMPADGKHAYFRPVEGEDDPWNAADPSEGGFWAGGKHWSEVIADDFSAFLAPGDGRPWFMFLSFNAPHDPRQSPQEFLDLYPLEQVAVPANFLPLYPHRAAMGSDRGLRDENLAPFPRTGFAVKTHRREYHAIVSHLDAQIGRILDELEKSPAGEETYVFFTADHGLACGEHGLMGKQNMYDASVRVPFIVAGPGVPAGRVVEAPVYLQDVMPTVLALVGAAIPESVDFQDMRPHWLGDGVPRRAVTGAYRDLQRMIVKDGKKLILYPAAKVFRVFDLVADPAESNDLAATPAGKELAAELFGELLAAQAGTGDSLELGDRYPELANAAGR
jgi:choline-sulfatase